MFKDVYVKDVNYFCPKNNLRGNNEKTEHG